MPDKRTSSNLTPDSAAHQLLDCGACGMRFSWLDATAVHTSEGTMPICPSCMSLANR